MAPVVECSKSRLLPHIRSSSGFQKLGPFFERHIEYYSHDPATFGLHQYEHIKCTVYFDQSVLPICLTHYVYLLKGISALFCKEDLIFNYIFLAIQLTRTQGASYQSRDALVIARLLVRACRFCVTCAAVDNVGLIDGLLIVPCCGLGVSANAFAIGVGGRGGLHTQLSVRVSGGLVDTFLNKSLVLLNRHGLVLGHIRVVGGHVGGGHDESSLN